MSVIGDSILRRKSNQTPLHRPKFTINSDKVDAAGSDGSPSVTNTARSSSIPLPCYHVHRTESELQLSINEAEAKLRDLCMIYRFVNGIQKRQAVDQASIHEPRALSLSHHLHNSPYLQSQASTSSSQIFTNAPPKQVCGLSISHRIDTQSHTPSIKRSDSWSITGFESNDNPPSYAPSHSRSSIPYSQHGKDEDLLEDEGLFDMDL